MFYMNWKEGEWVGMGQGQKWPIDGDQVAMATSTHVLWGDI